MKKTAFLIVLSCVAISCASVEKDEQMSQNENISDDIITVVDQLYASIEYKPKENIKPDWDLIKSLFIDDANLIHVMDTTHIQMKVQDFINGYAEQINSGYAEMASEFEIHSTGDQFGKIAQVFSTYELKGVYGGQEGGKRGINSIQLLRINEGWKVSSIIWYDENPNQSIPDKYLK